VSIFLTAIPVRSTNFLKLSVVILKKPKNLSGSFSRSGNNWLKATKSGLLVLRSWTQIRFLLLRRRIHNRTCNSAREQVSIPLEIWQGTDKFDSSWFFLCEREWFNLDSSKMTLMTRLVWCDRSLKLHRSFRCHCHVHSACLSRARQTACFLYLHRDCDSNSTSRNFEHILIINFGWEGAI
jgi:hypothetical protein